MRRKIYVTASEMLELRNQGMSNHDIAKALDISYQTVMRYIGKQGRHMEGLAAFKDTPPHKQERKEEAMPVIPKYEPKANKEWFTICDNDFMLDYNKKVVIIRGKAEPNYAYGHSADGTILVSFDVIPDLVQFLAWAMRTRMEVTADAEEDQFKAKGSAV